MSFNELENSQGIYDQREDKDGKLTVAGNK